MCFQLILSNISEKTENNRETDQVQNMDPELPLFELATIANATDNFSINNKLGEGGFGPVYKVNLKAASQEYLFYWVTKFTYIFPGHTGGWTRNCCKKAFEDF